MNNKYCQPYVPSDCVPCGPRPPCRSIIGPPGPQGIRGPQGHQGNQGPQGPQGPAARAGPEISIITESTTIDNWTGDKLYLVECNPDVYRIPFIIYDISFNITLNPPINENSVISFRLMYKKSNQVFITTVNPPGTTYLDQTVSQRTFIYKNKQWLQINDIDYTNYFPTKLQADFSNNLFNYEGNRVSVSSDGNMVATGAPGVIGDNGVVYIYTRDQTTFNWSLQSTVSTVDAGYTGYNFGWSVALSGNKKVLVVGGVNTDYTKILDSNGARGSVWIYWWNDLTNLFEFKQVITPDPNNASTGYAVATNCNGKCVLFSSPWRDYGSIIAAGSADFYVYDPNLDEYRVQDSFIVSPDPGVVNLTRFGFALAMSSDTNIVVIGGPSYKNGDYIDAGAFWIFQRGTIDNLRRNYHLVQKFTIEASVAYLGCSIAISADGHSIVSGAANYLQGNGLCLVYDRIASIGGDITDNLSTSYIKNNFWTLTGNLQYEPFIEGGQWKLGWCVAMSGDGKTIVAGGFGVSPDPGVSIVYTRSENKWVERNELSYVNIPNRDSRYGESVALSADGIVLAVGRTLQNGNKGGVYIFS